MSRFEPIRGGYVTVDVDGTDYRIYFEEAGEGVPLICLHTSCADSRQWRHLLNDPEVTSRFRVVAFDMPFHGRSNPPLGWWRERYALSVRNYIGVIRAVWAALGLDNPVVMGCSIGGYVVLQLAHEFPDELRGIIGLQSIARSSGRYTEFLDHSHINGSEFVASWTYGLCSPYSPEEACRENWWYYAQGGPGVYAGNTAFGREFDMRDKLQEIDTSRCKVSIMSGEYDYSALPEMSKAVADEIAGSRFVPMEKMGHFPIIEDYGRFRGYLLPELEYMLT